MQSIRCHILLPMFLGLCVCWTQLSCAKMAKEIEMPFGDWTRGGQGGTRNHVLGGGVDPTRGRGDFGAISQPTVN